MAKRISPIRFNHDLDKWRGRVSLGAAVTKSCNGSTYGEDGYNWCLQIDLFFMKWTLSLRWMWKADNWE